MNNLPDVKQLQAAFDAPSPMTIGIEEEAMVLDPAGLDLLPRAAEIIERAAHPAIGPELPAAQIELRTAAHACIPEAAAELLDMRRRAAAAASGIARLACAGMHPFASVEGILNSYGRYGELIAEYEPAVRLQVVTALHVHVAVRPAECALAVYNAIRGFLPDIAAFAANCPFYGGIDSGYASVRPKVCETLPRQGVPPIITGLSELADDYVWGMRAGALRGAGSWWWEARLNPKFGTLEIRVPDAQTTVGETAVVAALVHSLSGWLAARHRVGELPAPPRTWRVEQNRWRACRFGLDAALSDLQTGAVRPARGRWNQLLDQIEPFGEQLGCSQQLDSARDRLHRSTTAEIHRKIVASAGVGGLAAHLADRFLEPGW